MTDGIQPFISTVSGTLDAKGRVCIPSAYREILAATNTAGVYVCPSFSETALECFGADVLNAVQAKYADLDPFFSKEHDDKTFAVLSMTQLLSRDETGRVVLPAPLIAHAELKDRVTFVGMGRKFMIWDSEKFAAYQAERLKRALALRNEGGA